VVFWRQIGLWLVHYVSVRKPFTPKTQAAHPLRPPGSSISAQTSPSALYDDFGICIKMEQYWTFAPCPPSYINKKAPNQIPFNCVKELVMIMVEDHLQRGISQYICVWVRVYVCVCVCVHACEYPCIYTTASALRMHASMCAYFCLHVKMGLCLPMSAHVLACTSS